MARVLGRLRLSRSGEDSTSIHRQEEHVERWARDNGHTVVGWAIDEDFSRSVDPLTAPRLGPWLTDPLRVAQWDILVSWRVDRLGAGWKLSKLFVWIKENGKDLVCTDVPFPLSDRNGWLAFTMYAEQSEREWEGIQARNLDSQRKAREEGRYHGGPPAYWLQAVKRDGRWQLVLDSEPAAVVERMITGYLAGRPLEAMADEFAEEGVLPPEDYRRVRDGKEPKGSRWYPTSLRKILANPVLYGVKTRKVGDLEYEVVYDPSGQPVQAAQPLITAARFEEIRAETARRAALRTPRREEGASSLLGVVVCRECSGPAHLQTQTRQRASGETKEYRYYRFPCKHPGRFSGPELEEIVHEEFIQAVGAYPRLQPVYVPAEDHTVELEQAQRAYEELVARFAASASETARKAISGQLSALEGRMATLEALPRTEARMEYRATGETFSEAWVRMDDQERRQLMLDTGVQARTSKVRDTGETSVLLRFPAGFLRRLGVTPETASEDWELFTGNVPESQREYEETD